MLTLLAIIVLIIVLVALRPMDDARASREDDRQARPGQQRMPEAR